MEPKGNLSRADSAPAPHIEKLVAAMSPPGTPTVRGHGAGPMYPDSPHRVPSNVNNSQSGDVHLAKESIVGRSALEEGAHNSAAQNRLVEHLIREQGNAFTDLRAAAAEYRAEAAAYRAIVPQVGRLQEQQDKHEKRLETIERSKSQEEMPIKISWMKNSVGENILKVINRVAEVIFVAVGAFGITLMTYSVGTGIYYGLRCRSIEVVLRDGPLGNFLTGGSLFLMGLRYIHGKEVWSDPASILAWGTISYINVVRPVLSK